MVLCYIMHITSKRHTSIHTYSLSGHVLESVSDHLYLGLQIFDDLKWNKHTRNVVSKASIALGMPHIHRIYLTSQVNTWVWIHRLGPICPARYPVYRNDPKTRRQIQSQRLENLLTRFHDQNTTRNRPTTPPRKTSFLLVIITLQNRNWVGTGTSAWKPLNTVG